MDKLVSEARCQVFHHVDFLFENSLNEYDVESIEAAIIIAVTNSSKMNEMIKIS